MTMTINGSGVITGSTAPAFSAYQSSAQSLGSTLTKINLQAEEFDTNNCFDSASTYRFTPNVAGYYQINAGLGVSTTACQVIINIYKNGTAFRSIYNTATSAGIGNGSQLIYMNGTTDYLEMYGSFSTTQNVGNSWFQGSLVRSA